MDELNQALNRIGNPRAKINAAKKKHLAEFFRLCQPYDEHARAALQRLDKLVKDEIGPFIAKLNAANVLDDIVSELAFELKRLVNKPGELRTHLAALRATTFETMASTIDPDQLDQRKRDWLVQFYEAKLVKFGDVEGAARSLMTRIQERVIALARPVPGHKPPIRVPGFNPLSKNEGNPELKVLTNFPPEP